MPKKSGENYVIIKIPVELVDEIDKMMGKFGYRSRAEFVKDAVRRLLRIYSHRLREAVIKQSE